MKTHLRLGVFSPTYDRLYLDLLAVLCTWITEDRDDDVVCRYNPMEESPESAILDSY